MNSTRMLSTFLVLGLVLGGGIGIVFGSIYDNISMGIVFGGGFGLVLGLAVGWVMSHRPQT